MAELTEEQKKQAREDWLCNSNNVSLFGLLFNMVVDKYPSNMPKWMLPN